MRINSKLRLIFLLLLSFTAVMKAQSDNFDLQSYKTFLASHQNLSSEQLQSMHPAGVFTANLKLNFSSAYYNDSIRIKYNLTPDEISLIEKNGFMVSERFKMKDFITAFSSVYNYDLPVFVSTDAILDAVHRSYSKILKDVEVQVLIPKLTEFLKALHEQLPSLASDYQSVPEMDVMLKDYDVYITVARKLLDGTVSPYYSSNNNTVSDLLQYIDKAVPQDIKLFSDTTRPVDFSQFTPRGHYVDSYQPGLAKYFKAMMWLGRIEIYLTAPRARYPMPAKKDIQRQSILASLVLNAAEKSNSFRLYDDINGILQFFIGESDNVSLTNMRSLTQELNISKAGQLLDTLTLKRFQDTLKTKSYAFQRILSQIIVTGVNDPDSIIPASAFLLFGQRFIIDSYVTGQVVFDKIKFNDYRIKRMIPSSQDVLFALGNDASAQLLKSELDRFHYGQNLAALRYLIDSYGDEFWNVSLYNMWLSSLRKLNPPEDRTKLPPFMQTGAFWQEKMNTQLSSWAQLRHDNLLYAKQSYTGVPMCSFPYGYVEPFPEFYRQIKTFADKAKDYFQKVFPSGVQKMDNIISYLGYLSSVCDTLTSISVKELNGAVLDKNEDMFLKSLTSYSMGGCDFPYYGWYPRLLYKSASATKDMDCVVADVHTVPADSLGTPTGWVMHAGTGPVNLGVFLVPGKDNSTMACVGPVMSYYEYLTTDFKRLTDEEWENSLMATAPYVRPDLVNVYLTDRSGKIRPEGASLITSAGERTGDRPVLPESIVLAGNFPNPFNSSTVIKFVIPYNLSLQRAKLTIYNIQGEVISELVNDNLPSGTYIARWDGRNSSGAVVPSGVYFYNLTVGTVSASGKMSLIK